MSNSIGINKDTFENAARLFKNAADGCKANEARVKSVTDDLLASWQGESVKAFSEEYKEITKGMYNYDEMLRLIGDELACVAKTFDEADNMIKKIFHLD